MILTTITINEDTYFLRIIIQVNEVIKADILCSNAPICVMFVGIGNVWN